MNKLYAYFACTTPYQIIGAINIVVSKKIVADLYILGIFNNYKAIADKIENQGLFRKVICVSPDEVNVTKDLFTSTMQMLFANRIVKSYLEDSLCYDVCYKTSNAQPKLLLEHVLLSRNPEMQFVYYDDGTGTYFADSRIFEKSTRRKILEKLLHWKHVSADSISFLVRAPELLKLPEKYSSCRIEKMAELDASVRQVLLDIFDLREKDRIGTKVIIFDDLRGAWNDVDEKTVRRLDEAYAVIADACGTDNVICKPHPRSTEKISIDIKEYANTGIPMEILYSEMQDVEDRVLISYSSTAIFTPKLLFNKEPYIIALNNVVPISDSYKDLFMRFSMLYENQDRIVVPESIEQLHRVSARLCEERNDSK